MQTPDPRLTLYAGETLASYGARLLQAIIRQQSIALAPLTLDQLQHAYVASAAAVAAPLDDRSREHLQQARRLIGQALQRKQAERARWEQWLTGELAQAPESTPDTPADTLPQDPAQRALMLFSAFLQAAGEAHAVPRPPYPQPPNGRAQRPQDDSDDLGGTKVRRTPTPKTGPQGPNGSTVDPRPRVEEYF